ncbi:hypothetical protein CANTEDRAFT_115404 [Yamadazyma tenuis ATCC 10573]|uniref:Uncharacterized protein n=1 Tax=Candida tenuis (strain ATCC 10573 / BCRC 21748 / CBS 615 / JCM 9827 / NBRC 10315 / NRRL Y-1498 / VKM Y-70) TaxID=590646 RepID=G3B9Q9_CANTC|nr:uncharacterized protein CANTEDRAFT_115404 [Yamadazyma tenuis ATCC 10573]EGV61948.1 hypothetical protein CANTEDRAFT_115404 [Yamadazyma tenuis ATCC 10573]
MKLQQEKPQLKQLATKRKQPESECSFNKRAKVVERNANGTIKNVDTDKIDPIERLLSLNNRYDCDLNTYLQQEQERVDEDSDDYDDSDESESDEYSSMSRRTSEINEVSLNFSKIVNDNLLRYEPFNFINQNSSFAMLNNHSVAQNVSTSVSKSEVPFFRSVNFNPQPKQNVIDELLNLDDEIEQPVGPKDPIQTNTTGDINATTTSVSDSEEEELTTPKNSPLMTNSKMCFNYRQHDHLNLSNFKPQPSDLKILNENSIFSGKLNETIGSGRFLINDFFL